MRSILELQFAPVPQNQFAWVGYYSSVFLSITTSLDGHKSSTLVPKAWPSLRQGDFLGSLDQLTQAIAISPEEDEGLYIMFQWPGSRGLMVDGPFCSTLLI